MHPDDDFRDSLGRFEAFLSEDLFQVEDAPDEKSEDVVDLSD